MTLEGQLPTRVETATLSAVLALQIGAAIFFLFDASSEAFDDAGKAGFALSVGEVVMAVALLLGIGATALYLRRLIENGRERDQALAMARGSFAELVDCRFVGWKLSPKESVVALLSLKGYSIAEIATIQNTAQGTVRSQLSQIYMKAGVSGQAALASLFIEDLLDDPLQS